METRTRVPRNTCRTIEFRNVNEIRKHDRERYTLTLDNNINPPKHERDTGARIQTKEITTLDNSFEPIIS